MRKHYNKLVRDRIPELIAQHNKQFEVSILSESEYRQALLAKLVEEAQEVAQASRAELTVELADLYEVIDSILQANDSDRSTVQFIQDERRSSRGGFTYRILLRWS